jgi:hypothetical protein
MFEWYVVRSAEQSWVRGMNLDPSISCAESFPNVDASDIKFISSHGKAGVADIHAADEPLIMFGQDGVLGAFIAQTDVDLDSEPLPVPMRKDTSFTQVVINNSQVIVVKAEGETRQHGRFLMFKKNDRTWHLIPVPGDASNLRGFGKFISVVEANTKRAIATQKAKGTIYINQDVREKEVSPGRAEWRETDGRMGPNMEESFEAATAVFPGRLQLYDVETNQLFSIETKQGDSEVLLVEGDTFYYRVSDRLYSAAITPKGFGASTLLATDEAIRDAHWAFIKH